MTEKEVVIVQRAGTMLLVVIVFVTLIGVGAAIGVLVMDPENAGVIAAIIIGFLASTNTGLFSALKAEQAAQAAHIASLAVRKDIDGVHKTINSRMTQLLESSGRVKYAEGQEAGSQQNKAEVRAEVREAASDAAVKETTAAVKETTAAVEEVSEAIEERKPDENKASE